MKRFLFLVIFQILTYSCVSAQERPNTKNSINPQAKKLNDSAVSLVQDSTNYAGAIILIDQALKIDSNYLGRLIIS